MSSVTQLLYVTQLLSLVSKFPTLQGGATSEDWPRVSARIMDKNGEKAEELSRAGQEGAGIK